MKSEIMVRRLGLMALLLLAGPLAFTGCQTAPLEQESKAPAAAAPVLDYGNGWYHTANGQETVTAIAARYQRDPALVTLLNKTTPGAVPASGSKLYIPPSNDRARIREILLRVQAHPEWVPQTPWSGKAGAAAESPAATAPKLAALASPSPAPSASPSPAPAKKDPPAAAAHRTGWLHRLFHPHEETTSGELPDRAAMDALNQNAAMNADSAGSGEGAGQVRPAQPGDYHWPTDSHQIITPFNTGWKQACHGIEIAAPEGDPVYAARDGKVLMAQPFMSYGNLIVIDHGDGYATAYGFNQQIFVRVGQTVRAGQRIANVGRPSQGSKSKLFFQVRRNALPVDPLQVLPPQGG